MSTAPSWRLDPASLATRLDDHEREIEAIKRNSRTDGERMASIESHLIRIDTTLTTLFKVVVVFLSFLALLATVAGVIVAILAL